MSKFLFIIPILFQALYVMQYCQTIPNGLYLVIKIDTVETKLSELQPNEKAVFFSRLFEEYNGVDYQRLIIDTTQFVPIELEKAPEAVSDSDAKKKLLLSLTKNASDKLAYFTDKNLDRFVAIVLDDEAMTMHKIKTVITGGQLQITRCNDNACEKLLIILKDNEKK